MSDVADLPDDIEALKAMIAAQGAVIARQDAQLRHHQLMIEKLKARLDKQLRDRFGSSAEGLEQLKLMLEDLEITHSASLPASEPEPAPKDKPARKPLPDHRQGPNRSLSPGTPVMIAAAS